MVHSPAGGGFPSNYAQLNQTLPTCLLSCCALIPGRQSPQDRDPGSSLSVCRSSSPHEWPMTQTSIQNKKASKCPGWTPEAGPALTLTPVISQSEFHIQDFHSQPAEPSTRRDAKGSRKVQRDVSRISLTRATRAFHVLCFGYIPKKEEVAPACCTQTSQILHPFLHPSLHSSNQIPKLKEDQATDQGLGTIMEVDSQEV